MLDIGTISESLPSVALYIFVSTNIKTSAELGYELGTTLPSRAVWCFVCGMKVEGVMCEYYLKKMENIKMAVVHNDL